MPIVPIGPDIESQELNDNFSYIINNPSLETAPRIINGNLDIFSRGTTGYNPATNVYLADRWKVQFNAGGATFPANITHSQQLLASGDIPYSFYYYRVSTDGAGSGYGNATYYRLTQLIENATRYLCGAGKKVTISFWVRSNIVNKKLGIYAQQSYGTGGSPSAVEQLTGTVFTLTPTWSKYIAIFGTATNAGKTFGTNNDDRLAINIVYAWGSDLNASLNTSETETFIGAGYIDIAQIKIDIGDTALAFIPMSLMDEYKACKRYCIIPQTSQYVRAATYTANTIIFEIPVTVEMRINPTIRGLANTDIVVNSVAGVAQSGFTFTAVKNQSSIVVTATKTGHGLTDACLEIKTTSGFDAEI